MSDKKPASVKPLSMDKLSEKVKQKLAESNSTASGPKKSKDDNSTKGKGGSDKKSKKHNNKKQSRSDNTSKTERGHSSRQDEEEEEQKEEVDGGSIQTEEDLLKEIEALGGSKEDLDLIDSVDTGSDSELEFDSAKEKSDFSLNGDISKYMKDIGFNVSDAEMKKNNQNDKSDKKAGKKDTNSLTEKKKPAENSVPAIAEEPVDVSSIVHTGKLLLAPRPDWYNPEDLEPAPIAAPISPADNNKLLQKAKEMLAQENNAYAQTDSKSSSQKKFLSQMLTSGTLSDKISALTLLIQESPLHSMKYLDSLLNLCKKKSKSSAMQGIASLKDLFVGGVLPDRKLKWFKNQQVSGNTPKEWLILYAYEDWLKGFYFSLLQILETLSHDSVQYIRRNTANYIVDLLKAKPEQEVNLLRLGVNKLGDKDRNVASAVVQLLLRLEEAHPAMKQIIVEGISELIFRPGSDYHARYYGVITLNQTTLLHKEPGLANSLMKIYLTLFERLLSEWNAQKPQKQGKDDAAAKKQKKPRWKNKGNKGKKGGERQEAKTSEALKEEEDSKMTNAILTGLVRAFPFSDLPKETFNEHMDSLYRVTHSANFGTSLQALKLIFQVSKSQSLLSDRFYRTLYESLLDPRLAIANKHLKDYMNLLFRSLKEDSNKDRLKAFAKRIVQMSTSWLSIGVVSAVVFLLHELSKSSPHLRELFNEEQLVTDTKEAYDGRKRDPAYAHAENTKLWELVPLLSHYHPTVTVYAQGYMEDDAKLARPDLDLHTLNHFLDRFVYKNPRQKAVTRGGAIMQPLSGGSLSSTEVPVTVTDWSNKNLEDVDVSERFFHQYFSHRDKQIKPRNEGEELGEDEVWKALVESNPDEAGDYDEEDEIDFDDEDISDMDMDDMDMDDMSDIEELDDDEEDEDDDEEEDEVEQEGQDADLKQDDDDSEFGGFDSDEEQIDSDEEVEMPSKRKADDDGKEKNKKRRLKDLPEFASVEDYAHLLGSDDDDY